MTHIALLSLTLFTADPTEITGRVVSIADGDTITILVDKQQVKVRLEGIDAPEKGQPWGTKARERLADLVHEKTVRVVVTGKDRYGRSLGTVHVGETNVNAEMVKAGLAWHYKRFSKDREFAVLELEAREAKRGLWSDKEPIPPWEWRSEKRKPDSNSK